MLPRLRGGAKEDREPSSMIEIAIANATEHGINLHQGVENLANGNCLFETVIDSINTRVCFNEQLNETPDFYRNLWMSELEKVGYNDWNNGRTKDQWKDEWDVLKQSGKYEFDLGDLVPLGIAHCIKKDILVFNTFSSAHSPIYVIEASKLCNQFPDTDIPICLAYNGSHYEMLVPDTNEDITQTIKTKTDFVSGNYRLSTTDINIFSERIENKIGKKKQKRTQILERKTEKNLSE